MVQPDMKKLVAYSSVSHSASSCWHLRAERAGVQGSVYQMLNHGVSTGACSSSSHAVGPPPHPADCEFGGLKAVMPRLVAVPARDPVVDRPAGLNGFRRRVPDPARTSWDPRSPPSAGVILSPSTCSGCSSGSTTARHQRREPVVARPHVRERWHRPDRAAAIVMACCRRLPAPDAPSVERLLQRVGRESIARSAVPPASDVAASATGSRAARVKN